MYMVIRASFNAVNVDLAKSSSLVFVKYKKSSKTNEIHKKNTYSLGLISVKLNTYTFNSLRRFFSNSTIANFILS